jgi:pSer/pThr/pTyr-binding forkhead associated (FHA) protein
VTQCPSCGSALPAHHAFCGHCGAPMRGSYAGSSASQDTLFFGPLQTPGRAKLIVIRGEGGAGVSYALNATEHVAGRTSGVILFQDDPYLSDEHANFRYREGELYLSDLGSRNGTFLRLRGPEELRDGMVFSCGQQVLRVDRIEGRSEYPSADGTLHYVSPHRNERIRVVQLLEGGLLGRTVSSPVDELTIGREGCDLCVPNDAHLSRRHAKVALERDGRIRLTDLGSKNGTFVRLEEEVHLQHGDYVFLGKELLRVEIIGSS